MAFFPLAAETFGWWHRVGEREVKKLGSDTWDRRRARLSTTSGVVWQFCCSGATLQFWETGFLISHHHKLMDYTSKKYDLLAPSGALIAIPTYYWSAPAPTFSDHTGPRPWTFTFSATTAI